jgi:tRNA(Ile)-lysidine synthase TilS/MesJ
MAMTAAEIRERVRDGGLLSLGRGVVAMLSGGRDSVCLLDVAVALCGAEQVQALHVNYGLRAESDEDERHCRELCALLGVEIEVVQASREAQAVGNLHAWARELRYAAAQELAQRLDERHGAQADEHGGARADEHGGVRADEHRGVRADEHGGVRADEHGGVRADEHGGVRADEHGGARADEHRGVRTDEPLHRASTVGAATPAAELDAAGKDLSKHDAPPARAGHRAFLTLIATGHTATDQVETILYRLASSPGRRALLGMASSEGRLVRPLLGLTRQDTAAYCQELKLAWHEDSSNDSEIYARARVRHGLVKALDAVHPAAQANVLRTAALLREETELLDALVDAELGAGASIAIEHLRQLAPALQRLVVIRLAEQASGEFAPQAGERVGEILALGARGGRAELHVGGLAGAVIEDGMLRMVAIRPREQRPSRPSSGLPRHVQADAHEPHAGAREGLPEPTPVDAEDLDGQGS